jgi:hypothetical protein
MIQNEDKQDKNTTQKTKKMRKTDLTKNSGVNPGARGKNSSWFLLNSRRCSYVDIIATKNIYGRHHDLVDRCEISISQMAMDLLLFTYMFSFLDLSLPRHLLETWLQFQNSFHIYTFLWGVSSWFSMWTICTLDYL